MVRTAATYRGVYDALGERKDCSTEDRHVADQLADVLPGGAAGAKALSGLLRGFVKRAGRMMIDAEVDQFLECGVDLSLREPLHDFLQRCSGPSRDTPRVIYLDDDPAATAHARTSIGAGNSSTRAALVDHRDPLSAMTAPVDGNREPDSGKETVRDCLKSEWPIGLIHCGLLPHLGDRSAPAMMADLLRRWDVLLPQGSFIALSHFCVPPSNPPLAAVAAKVEEIFTESALGAGVFLTPEQFADLFRGHALVQPAPGHLREVVPVDRFWPDGPALDRHSAAVAPVLWGGVARKGAPFGLLG
ncbi:SAM-dependent methyltransferase [Amycolatopsis coloradensis]|nr:SAM-dependent methyltransferase [Amycolatopsis coloradensis]